MTAVTFEEAETVPFTPNPNAESGGVLNDPVEETRQPSRTLPEIGKEMAARGLAPHPELRALIEQIARLMGAVDCDDDDDPVPSLYAVRTAFDLIRSTSDEVQRCQMVRYEKSSYPKGRALRDDGGLRIEWRRGAYSVHLVIGADERKKSYIYFNDHGRKSVELMMSPVRLANMLAQLPVD